MIEYEEELFAEAERVNKELALDYVDRQECLKRALATIGTTKLFMQKIVCVCLQMFTHDSFRRKWSDVKHCTFVEGLIAFIHIQGGFDDAESALKNINKLMFHYFSPFYTLFKDLVYKQYKEPLQYNLHKKTDFPIKLYIWSKNISLIFEINSCSLASFGILQAAFVLGVEPVLTMSKKGYKKISLDFRNNPCSNVDGLFKDTSMYGKVVRSPLNCTSSKNLKCDICKGQMVYPDETCFYCDIAPVYVIPGYSSPALLVDFSAIVKQDE